MKVYLEVDGEVKRETEKRHDDQVDQPDRDRGDDLVGVEGPEIILAEADRRTQRLRNLRRILHERFVARGILHHHLRPLLPDSARGFRHERVQSRAEDVVPVGGVSRADVDQLAGSEGVVRGIAVLNRGGKEGRRVGVDDDGGPGVEVEDGLADLQGVAVEVRRRTDVVA